MPKNMLPNIKKVFCHLHWSPGLLLPVLLFWGVAVSSCRSTTTPTASSPTTATPGKSAASDKQPAQLRTDIGFRTKRNLIEHYEKHGAEFGAITMEQYLRQAQQLRDQPSGDGILEAVRNDGVMTRFDRASGAFLAVNEDLTIRTFFRPNDGENYFRRQARRNPQRNKND